MDIHKLLLIRDLKGHNRQDIHYTFLDGKSQEENKESSLAKTAEWVYYFEIGVPIPEKTFAYAWKNVFAYPWKNVRYEWILGIGGI